MTTSDDVQKAIKDFSAYFGRLKTPSSSTSKRNFLTAKNNLAKIKEYLDSEATTESVESASDESQSTSIEGFFNAVGTGVREAQESLDLQSVQYMRNRPSFAPETMFRVPKVSANLKLGMTYSKETGINFLVVKSGSKTSRTMEQEISFDIVSAPPPPGTLEKFAELPIDPILVTNAIERELVMERLKQEKKSSTNTDSDVSEVIGNMLLGDASRRVLVIRGEKHWTLMLVKPPENREPPPSSPNLSASFLVLPIEQKDGVPKTLKDNRRMWHFYTLLFPIVDKQTRMLTDLDRI
jgi:hypothetical protein